MSRILNPKALGIIFLVLALMIGSRILVPVPLPGIQLPAEVPLRIGSLPLANTIIATLIADVIVLALAFGATRRMDLVPRGLQNVMEWIIEAWYNLAQDIAGPNAHKFFPWAMTIFLFLLVANWMEFIPGVDSIGVIESHANVSSHDASSPGGAEVEDSEVLPHYIVKSLLPGLSTIIGRQYQPTAAQYEEAHHALESGNRAEALPKTPEGERAGILVPFVRAAATDLNLTLALALVAVLMTQIYGVQALGAGYFSKFFNLKGGGMGLFVSIMELISEFSKILSFAFRLFGNIFGGQVLLFVMIFLVPFLLPLPFMALELFVGAIQAFVFGMLILIFFAGAVVSHDDHH